MVLFLVQCPVAEGVRRSVLPPGDVGGGKFFELARETDDFLVHIAESGVFYFILAV